MSVSFSHCPTKKKKIVVSTHEIRSKMIGGGCQTLERLAIQEKPACLDPSFQKLYMLLKVCLNLFKGRELNINPLGRTNEPNQYNHTTILKRYSAKKNNPTVLLILLPTVSDKLLLDSVSLYSRKALLWKIIPDYCRVRAPLPSFSVPDGGKSPSTRVISLTFSFLFPRPLAWWNVSAQRSTVHADRTLAYPLQRLEFFLFPAWDLSFFTAQPICAPAQLWAEAAQELSCDYHRTQNASECTCGSWILAI